MRIFHISLFLLGVIAVVPQQSEAQANIEQLDVRDIPVIIKKVPGDVIAVRLYVRGGSANYSKDQEGIESLALELAVLGGTGDLNRDGFSRAAENLGMGVATKAGLDYSYAGMTALKQNWNESWSLFSRALTSPNLDGAVFSRLVGEYGVRNRRHRANASNYIDEIATRAAFGDTDYNDLPLGSPESLQMLTVDNIREYYEWMMSKSNIFIVVVGNVETADVRQKIASALGDLPPGMPRGDVETATVRFPGVAIEHQDLDVNHVLGLMPAPPAFSEERVANLLAMSMFSDRITDELRNKRRLSFGPSAYVGTALRYTVNGLYMSTISPVAGIKVMVETLNETIQKGFDEDELNKKKPSFLTYHYLGKETVDAQAHDLGHAFAAGDWKWAGDMTDAIMNTTLDEVNAVFRKYARKINWSYLGNESQISTSDFLQPKRWEEPKAVEEKAEDRSEDTGATEGAE